MLFHTRPSVFGQFRATMVVLRNTGGGMFIRRVQVLIAGSLLAAVLSTPGIALAFYETTDTVPPMSEENCGGCHDPFAGSILDSDDNARIGVHGRYLVTSSKCSECHSVHAAPADGAVLLPGATITATCFTCHDGTATYGKGVYGAIEGRGETVGGGHRIDNTSTVPGGNAADGGSSVGTFNGVDGTLTCTDCHAPHGANMVEAFLGERTRTSMFSLSNTYRSSKLLKQLPGNATTMAPVYGSDWCLGCHAGRDSGLSTAHNHPVESISTYADATTRFSYSNVARLLVSTTPTGSLGQNNGGYLMPYPRTAEQSGHAPICQQCHEDARNVGSLSASGSTGTVNPFITNGADGTVIVNNNPRFRTFPHETQNYRMLVEGTTTTFYDDLCLNCHPLAQLP